MDIGFIGLGKMGFPMARRLTEAGHRLLVFDQRQEAVDTLVASRRTGGDLGDPGQYRPQGAARRRALVPRSVGAAAAEAHARPRARRRPAVLHDLFDEAGELSDAEGEEPGHGHLRLV